MGGRLNVTTPTTNQIIAAHADGNTQLLDQWACNAMGLSQRDSHVWGYDQYGEELCRNYVTHPKSHGTYCNRYTTDLSSALELELAIRPKDYYRDIEQDIDHNDVVIYRGRHVPHAGRWQRFEGQPLPISVVAGVLWAAAHERERQG